MNNLLIAALTFVMLPALTKEASAKSEKNCKMESTKMIVEKIKLTDDLAKNEIINSKKSEVDFDYIIEENGKAYITYINTNSQTTKEEVIKFIESATYNFNPIEGKVYSMKLSFDK